VYERVDAFRAGVMGHAEGSIWPNLKDIYNLSSTGGRNTGLLCGE
jgi:hypothetical protein